MVISHLDKRKIFILKALQNIRAEKTTLKKRDKRVE